MPRLLEKALAVLVGPFGFLLSAVTPKRSTRWAFGAWFGYMYSDNSRFLFEYVAQRVDSGVECAWICKSRSIRDRIRSQGLRAYLAYSPSGLWYQLTSRVFVCTINSFDFVPWLITPRNFVVQLWHGTPNKSIGLDAVPKYGFRWCLAKLRSLLTDKYQMVVSPDSLTDRVYLSAFGVQPDVLLHAGYPRWDAMSMPTSDVDKLRHDLGAGASRIWLYLPTHRGEGRAGTTPNVAVVRSLIRNNDILRDVDCALVVKPHFYERAHFLDEPSASHVRILLDLPEDISRCLAVVDGLVTDYSSVVFDVAPVKIPVVLFPYDIEEYRRVDRDVLIAPEEMSSTFYRAPEDVVRALHRISRGETPPQLNVPTSRYVAGQNSQIVFEAICRRLGLSSAPESTTSLS